MSPSKFTYEKPMLISFQDSGDRRAGGVCASGGSDSGTCWNSGGHAATGCVTGKSARLGCVPGNSARGNTCISGPGVKP
jgi:hypothetical protein